MFSALLGMYITGETSKTDPDRWRGFYAAPENPEDIRSITSEVRLLGEEDKH